MFALFKLILALCVSFVAATTCEMGDGGIKSPQPGDVITMTKPFNLTYCAYAYYKVQTIDIDVVVIRCGSKAGDPCPDFVSGEEIVHHLKRVEGEEYGYQVDATVLRSGGGDRGGQWAIGVLEHATGYYVQMAIYNHHVPVTFVLPDEPEDRSMRRYARDLRG
ncbi:hypothetical protein EJ05DRAFT_487802 [Pseudovirgaria hyperparasitica]|uniref:Uncharacterized protein n=1 Tax=Pseudovirgaria hyperparasitica TaxID=470096 RepID=A0A6A6W0B5_9PEZI|nr:uncharacterized protein EJ05DRAFT_487802 [Pseudovirgaria hyperparasitica]KAF2755983.1 hypothetical protein EJ05DRAFT_487802 [Pseudovirgaria hyperparasitica]